jgi:hypothetical protein
MYAADIEELQLKLQQQTSTANREKIRTYLEKTHKVCNVCLESSGWC